MLTSAMVRFTGFGALAEDDQRSSSHVNSTNVGQLGRGRKQRKRRGISMTVERHGNYTDMQRK